ncbi:MAG: substrate-binding domain-containing protein [Pacificimonas sp.]|nr:substrate-binding domain-containing protein [Pacificimonas sp.]
MFRYLALGLAGLALAACSGGDGGESDGYGGSPIRIVGSSTVYPFTTAVAENLTLSRQGMRTPIVESTGTGGGLQLFCGGVGPNFPDVANASRQIKPSEVERCIENGVNQIIEIQVGVDGIAFAQSRDAELFSITSGQLYRALAATTPEGEENETERWNEIDPSLPDRPIEVLGPPPTSGTRDAFNELVMTAGCKSFPQLAALEETDEDAFELRCTRLREDGVFVETGENDNLIVQKLVSNPRAIGIFGYSYLEENLDKVQPLPLDGTLPTYDVIASGEYPAARPLFIYVKGEHLGAKPALRDFMAEYTAEGTSGPDGYLRSRGLIALPEERRDNNRMIASEARAMDAGSL